jgi:membrane protein
VSSPDRNRRDTARAAQQQEETLRARWEETQERLLTRFEEPISFATRVTKRTLAWFPVRVWRHFLIANGFLLAAGVSYQALFAIFAAVYVAFALAGLWLGGSEQAIQNLIDLINQYVPGLIDKDGPITPDAVAEIATNSASLFGITGAIALVTLIWTAIGWVTFSRRAVREIFVLPPDRRPYLLLKSGDLLAAALFGILLLVGGALGAAGTWALDIVFSLLGLDTGSVWFSIGVRAATLLISFAINAAALAALFRFLTGTSLRWRTIWPGALLAGAAVTVLQLGAGWLLSYTPTNALLATFAIFVGLLLWFRLIGIIMLVGASWIAISARDENIPLLEKTEAEQLAEEHAALLLAAQVRLRTAQEARDTAPWHARWAATRNVRRAEEELHEVEASAPPAVRRPSALDGVV